MLCLGSHDQQLTGVPRAPVPVNAEAPVAVNALGCQSPVPIHFLPWREGYFP
jgi:hypothetical protein